MRFRSLVIGSSTLLALLSLIPAASAGPTDTAIGLAGDAWVAMEDGTHEPCSDVQGGLRENDVTYGHESGVEERQDHNEWDYLSRDHGCTNIRDDLQRRVWDTVAYPEVNECIEPGFYYYCVYTSDEPRCDVLWYSLWFFCMGGLDPDNGKPGE